MNPIIQNLLGDKMPALLQQLQTIGLSQPQAERFSSEVAEQAVGLVQDKASGLSPAQLSDASFLTSLMNKIDLDAIASRVGIDQGLAQRALQQVMPMLSQGLAGAGDLGKLASGLTGGGGGSMMDKVRNLFARSFG